MLIRISLGILALSFGLQSLDGTFAREYAVERNEDRPEQNAKQPEEKADDFLNKHFVKRPRNKEIGGGRIKEPKPMHASAPDSKRHAPGPEHGGNPNGDDPHDEQHIYGQDGYPKEDPYNGSTSNDRDHPYKPY